MVPAGPVTGITLPAGRPLNDFAIKLNKMKLSKRRFTEENIQKKMQLLCLKRTELQLQALVEKHQKTGRYASSKKDISKDGHVKAIIINGIPHPHIRVNSIYKRQARIVYEQHYGPIPAGYKVHCKDLNTMNLNPDNLELRIAGQLNAMERLLMLKIAKQNIEILNRKDAVIAEPKRGNLQDTAGKIKVVVNAKLTLYVKPGTNIEALIKKYNERGIAA